MKRENPIVIVLGIVMLIMALDHVLDLMHIDSIIQNLTCFRLNSRDFGLDHR